MKQNLQRSKRTELQRLLSKRGLTSRSQAAKLIRNGHVTVNGKVITNPEAYISVESKIAIEGVEKKSPIKLSTILIAFHKPKGCVTTTSDEKGRKTVYDVLPSEYKHLKAVGRLDMATSGLLLFTNDSVLLDRLLDPKNKIPRTYVVQVRGEVFPDTIARMEEGVIDKNVLLKSQKVEIRKSSGKESILIVTLIEGKNREIRRLCDALGHEVIKLKRISFGAVQLEDLPVGEVRVVSIDKELTFS